MHSSQQQQPRQTRGIGRQEVAGENHVVLAAAPEAHVCILFSGPGAVIKLSDHT